MQSDSHSRLKIGDKVKLQMTHELGILEILSLYASPDIGAKALLSGKRWVCVCDNLEDLVLIPRSKKEEPNTHAAEHRQYLKDLIKSD